MEKFIWVVIEMALRERGVSELDIRKIKITAHRMNKENVQ